MRYLAALLLLANLGLLAWVYTQPTVSPPVYRPVPVPPGISPLVLLSERADSSAQPSVSIERSAVEPPDIVAAPSEPVADVPPVERVCQTIGPLMRLEDVGQITQQLDAHGYAARQRSGKVRKPSGYWVYLPAMAAAEARRIVKKLDASGMKDYFIGKQNYISLGIFRRKEKAQVRFEQVAALGHEPVLDQRYRNQTVHWLDIEEAGQPLLTTSAWQQIQKQHPDVQIQRVSCE